MNYHSSPTHLSCAACMLAADVLITTFSLPLLINLMLQQYVSDPTHKFFFDWPNHERTPATDKVGWRNEGRRRGSGKQFPSLYALTPIMFFITVLFVWCGHLHPFAFVSGI